MKRKYILGLSVAASALLAACSTSMPTGAELDKLTQDILGRSFRDQGQAKLDRLSPDEDNRLCAEADRSGVELDAKLVDAIEQDWFEEYLAPILSVKVVSGVEEAIAHINHYSSHHTDAILTLSHVNGQRFIREVDSASVMINASTRFADGFEYGLGAEIGISTDKFHARGPVGIEGLTSLKFVVLGAGEVRT